MTILIENYKKMNKKLLEYNVNDKTKACVFHLMDVNATFNQVIGIWESNEIEGLSPKLSIEMIFNELYSTKSIFNDNETFDNCINEWIKKYFYTSMKMDESLKRAIVSRAILTCAHHFYIEISLKKYKNDLLKILVEENLLFRINDDEKKVLLYSRPSRKCIYRLNQFSNLKEINNKQFIITKEKGKSWSLIFNEKNNWKCTSEFLYSGVNIGVRKIKMLEKNQANRGVRIFQLTCVKTTYLTRMGIGITALTKPFYNENFINDHPYLNKYKQIFLKFESKEIKLQDDLMESLSKQLVISNSLLESINQYLMKTDYLPIVSVAGNVETADDFIICVKRGKNLESPNTYSCSVNGVTEVYDKNVVHYQFSDSNDRPSITSKMETFQFENELNREMMAELGVTQSLSWSILGLAIFQVPLTEKGEKKNALIFDVIGKTYMPFTLNQVRILQKSALENKENEKVFGYQLSMFNSKIDRFNKTTIQILKVMNIHKDLIGFSLVSLLFIFQTNLGELLSSWWRIMDIQFFFSCILLLLVIINFFELREQKKVKIKHNLIRKEEFKNKYLVMDIIGKHKKGDEVKANIALVLVTELEYLFYRKK